MADHLDRRNYPSKVCLNANPRRCIGSQPALPNFGVSSRARRRLMAWPAPHRPTARSSVAEHRHVPRRAAACPLPHGLGRTAVAHHPGHDDQARAPLVPVPAPLRVAPPVRPPRRHSPLTIDHRPRPNWGGCPASSVTAGHRRGHKVRWRGCPGRRPREPPGSTLGQQRRSWAPIAINGARTLEQTPWNRSSRGARSCSRKEWSWPNPPIRWGVSWRSRR